MNALGDAVKNIFQRAAELVPLADSDYEGVDERGNKAIFCGVCGEIKRKTVMMPDLRDNLEVKPIFVPRPCACGRKRAAEIKSEELELKRFQIRSSGGINPTCVFQTSERDPDIEKCWRYAQKWDEMKAQNIGLLLWGGNGPGKSHAAHCIANALIDRAPPVSVYAKTFAAILQGQFDKSEILDFVYKSSLVIFEDLGAERGNDYAFEPIFAIVDERYQARKPTIITTNLTWDEVRNPTDERGFPDRRRKRIYDRIVEMCVPIQFNGTSRRNAINAGKTAFVKNALGL